ncbi:MAG: hypothetical protein R2860_09580 [Desulfobacterales bacterium]
MSHAGDSPLNYSIFSEGLIAEQCFSATAPAFTQAHIHRLAPSLAALAIFSGIFTDENGDGGFG